MNKNIENIKEQTNRIVKDHPGKKAEITNAKNRMVQNKKDDMKKLDEVYFICQLLLHKYTTSRIFRD